ncbi:hypothetical protein [Pseudomonas putida]
MGLHRKSGAGSVKPARLPSPQPVDADIKQFVEAQINAAAKKIVDKKKHDFDHFANGQLGYLLALRRWIENTSTREDLGLHDAIDDVLQLISARKSKTTYIKGLL